MKALATAMILAGLAVGVLMIATMLLLFGPIGDDGPGVIYTFAPFVAAILFSLMIPARRAILRALVAMVLAFGLNAAMAGPWYAADVARNGPMPWKGEAVAMVTWFIGLPASLIVAVLVLAGSWLWARRGETS